MLQFVVDHDYKFKAQNEDVDQTEETQTKASLLQKRENKCNLKIASLIEKVKRS
jgi:hypothetical protein